MNEIKNNFELNIGFVSDLVWLESSGAEQSGLPKNDIWYKARNSFPNL